MAEFIGVEGIHAVSGTCDLCGDTVDPNTQELNVLGCTFKQCEPHPYHQDCLEKYLKSIRCERNRKTGFKCPRGTGKGTSHKDPCPGKIDKSHPIHPRNEEQKKKKKAKLPELMQVPPRGAVKEKDKAAGKAAKEAAPAAAAAAAASKKAPPAAPKPAPPKPPPKPAPPPEDPRKKLAEAVAAARREIQAGGRPKEGPVMGVERPTPPAAAPVAVAAAGSGRALSTTLDAFLPSIVAGSGTGGSTAVQAAASSGGANAWGKHPPPGRPAAAAAAAAAAATPPIAAVRAGPAMAPGLTPSSSSGSGWGPALDTALSRTSSLGRAASGGVVLADVAKAGGLVGAEYVEDEDGAGLTKAQKKNLKRAQKKKNIVAAETNSVASSDAGELVTPAPTPAPIPAPMEAAPAAPRLPPPPPAAAAAAPLQAAPTSHVNSQAGAAAAPVIKPAKPAPVPAAVPPPPPVPQRTVAAASAAAPSTAPTHFDISSSSALSSSQAAGVGAAAAAGSSAAGGSADVSLLEEVALQGLVAFRAGEAVAALVRLGFPLWAAAAGVQRHGLRLVEAIAWLLDVGPTLTPGTAVSAVLSCVPEVAAAEEEADLAALLQEVGGDGTAVYTAVLDAGGDLAKARVSLLPGSERSSSASNYASHPSPGAAATFGNGPGFSHSSVAARPVLPGLAPAADHAAWLPSLNGPSGMQPANSSSLWQQVPGPEATLANWRQQQQDQPQQQQQQQQWPSGGGLLQPGMGVHSATSHWLQQQQYSNSLAAALPVDPFTCSSPGREVHRSGSGLALLGPGDSDDTDLEGLMATLMQQ